jgi:multidrug efflux pump subunit AcrB
MGPNLSDWAIRHKTLIVYSMILVLVAGVLSYIELGREEDPQFPIMTMIVQTNWPGATTAETMDQITERIEKKLEETPSLDYVKSYTKPGISVVYVNLLDSTDPKDIPEIWYQVRKKISDIKQSLPKGTQGPFFNDEFGDVFGIIYGLTFDGFSLRETRDFAETARAAFLRVKDVGKVEIFGDQDEKIYLHFSPQRLAELGLTLDQVLQAIAQQNALAPSGVISTQAENMLVQVSGALVTEHDLRDINLYINGRFVKLSSIANVERTYVDPPTKMFRVNGKPAIGIGISMRPGANVLQFGDGLHAVAEELVQRFPIGIEVVQVSDQPEVVKESIHGFTKALYEAVGIVLGVSFLSLGVRAGLVVATSIPLVLTIVFLCMEFAGISLQRISLGALIISLGLLVDDAMITVEMMVAQIESGAEKHKAAVYAYTHTAFPMLTGTLVTISGFVPIGFARSGTGTYCISLFSVVAIALVVSWFVAVLYAPVIGVTVLPAVMKGHGHGGEGHGGQSGGIGGWGSRAFRATLLLCMRRRYLTIAVTLGAFALALLGVQFVQKQFFPASDRPEVLVTMMLPKNASIYATQADVERAQKMIDGDPNVVRYSAYVGGGAIRFYLPLDVQLDNDFLAQFVIVTKGLEEREAMMAKLVKGFAEDFPDVLARVQRLELGPPVGWPIQYRVLADTTEEVRVLADKLADLLRASPDTQTINFDWSEKSKTLRLDVDQDKARRVGLSTQALQEALNTMLNGIAATQLRDSIYLIDVQARAQGTERVNIDSVRNLRIQVAGGQSIPLREVATVQYVLDDAYVWRRSRLPTITVQADVRGNIQAPTVYQRMQEQIDALRATLPPGQEIQDGGTVEKSAIALASISAVMPLMVMLMLTVLMVQLESFQRLFLVVSVAPLGVIGVVAMLLPAGIPMGFVAILGIIALAGMIIRNSVILIVQIEDHRRAGEAAWSAVISATEHRLRPILLTASAAILGMIPIMHEVFWGPMAFAVVGGLVGATLLTVLFLPALYVAWFRISEPAAREPKQATRLQEAAGQ